VYACVLACMNEDDKLYLSRRMFLLETLHTKFIPIKQNLGSCTGVIFCNIDSLRNSLREKEINL